MVARGCDPCAVPGERVLSGRHRIVADKHDASQSRKRQLHADDHAIGRPFHPTPRALVRSQDVSRAGRAGTSRAVRQRPAGEAIEQGRVDARLVAPPAPGAARAGRARARTSSASRTPW